MSMSMEDAILFTTLASIVVLVAANYAFTTLVKSAGRRHPLGIDDAFFTLLALVIVYGSYWYVYPDTFKFARDYKPPVAVNLVFWGLDRNAENVDYEVVNDFIKVTNSRVVLFGKAKQDPPLIDNIIASTPKVKNELQAVLLWFDSYREEVSKWEGGIAVFGLNIRVKPAGYEMFFEHPTPAALRAATRTGFDMKHHGVFGLPFTKGLLCNFETTNSPKGSGRRPLKSLANDWRGL